MQRVPYTFKVNGEVTFSAVVDSLENGSPLVLNGGFGHYNEDPSLPNYLGGNLGLSFDNKSVYIAALANSVKQYLNAYYQDNTKEQAVSFTLVHQDDIWTSMEFAGKVYKVPNTDLKIYGRIEAGANFAQSGNNIPFTLGELSARLGLPIAKDGSLNFSLKTGVVNGNAVVQPMVSLKLNLQK